MRSILLGFLTLSATSCAANFSSMTEDELTAYNSTVAPEEQVYCYQQRVGKKIMRTSCRTASQLAIEGKLGRTTDPNLVINH